MFSKEEVKALYLRFHVDRQVAQVAMDLETRNKDKRIELHKKLENMVNFTLMRTAATILLSCFLTALAAQTPGDPVHRYPAVAGSFYPARPEALEPALKKLMSDAEPSEQKGRIQSLIVPHAGYAYSGEVAAAGYKSLPSRSSYDNIFIIASSHREQFTGSSIYSAGNYFTPLGEVEVNRDLAKKLIDSHPHLSFLPEAHDREHSIEVQLPFLQHRFSELPPIVPIVMGSSSVENARDLAGALLPYYTAENLFVISSDFSHYPPYENALRVDRRTADAILTGDPSSFYNTLRKNSREGIPNLATSCCGWSSILTLLYMSQRRDDLVFEAIRYMNSGDATQGDRSRVVGYWAIAARAADPSEALLQMRPEDKDRLLTISRKTLESYLLTGEIPLVDEADLPASLTMPAGAFVSLYMGDRLRGCIGHFNSSGPLYRTIQEMTLSAAMRDSRFAAVEPPELEYLRIEISVLTPLKLIRSVEELELGRHGIYMTKDGRSGTFLPQVAEDRNWSREDFLGHCAREKAGIGWEGWKEADLYTYEAIVFGEGAEP